MMLATILAAAGAYSLSAYAWKLSPIVPIKSNLSLDMLT